MKFKVEEFLKLIDFLSTCSYEFVKMKQKFDLKKFKHIKDALYVCRKNFSFGAYAYYLKPSGAKKFILHLKKMYIPIDYYTDMFYKHGVLNYHYLSDAIYHNAPQEEASNLNFKDKKHFISKIIRPSFKLYWHLQRYVFMIFHRFNF